MPPARPHVVLWISIIMVGLASAAGTAIWRGVVVCEVGHLWAILNTFTAGNYRFMICDPRARIVLLKTQFAEPKLYLFC
jgi:hypothetical protein